MFLTWLLACGGEDPSTVDPIDEAPEVEDTDLAPADPEVEQLDHGGELYGEHCARCHGADGDGTTDLPEVASDRLVEQILEGSDVYPQMPAFADVLNDREVDHLALYVEVVLWGRD